MPEKKQYVPSNYNLLAPLENGRVLAFNTLAKTLAVWEGAEAAVYERYCKNGCFLMSEKEQTMIEELIRGRFIVEENANEMRRIEEAYSMLRFGARHMTLTIAPTLQCNFACDYCYQGKTAAAEVMSEEVFSGLLSFLEKKAAGLRHLHVAWYGGEPLLQTELIYEMSDRLMQWCARKSVRYSAMMVTNGYFLSGDTAQRMAEKQVSSIQVTLDGDKETHDARRIKKDGAPTFDRILNNLKDAVGRPGVGLVVRVNIDSRNVSGIEGLLQYLSEQGFSGQERFGVYFAPVDVCSAECTRIAKDVLTRGEYAKIEIQLLKRAVELGLARAQLPGSFTGMCAALKPNGFVLLPNGDVHKCWNTVSDASMRACTVETLEHADETENTKQWLNWSPFSKDACRQCVLLPLCTGACANREMLGNSEPCISLKENIKERLLLYALQQGAIVKEDIPDGEKPVI